jgi:hypothetical protein
MTSRSRPDHEAPALIGLVREAGALLELYWKTLLSRRVEQRSRGRDRPVMVIPGFLASDASTRVLRRALRGAGHDAYGWGLGLNWGVRADLLDRLEERIGEIAGSTPVTLIGWSLGGLYARELAKAVPSRVERVITLGSPFSGDIRGNNAWRLYELLNDHRVDCPPIEAKLHEKPPLPTFALWSPKDGIVAPACARGQAGQCDKAIEVKCSHLGFATAPCVVEAVLELLTNGE